MGKLVCRHEAPASALRLQELPPGAGVQVRVSSHHCRAAIFQRSPASCNDRSGGTQTGDAARFGRRLVKWGGSPRDLAQRTAKAAAPTAAPNPAPRLIAALRLGTPVAAPVAYPATAPAPAPTSPQTASRRTQPCFHGVGDVSNLPAVSRRSPGDVGSRAGGTLWDWTGCTAEMAMVPATRVKANLSCARHLVCPPNAGVEIAANQ